MKRVVLAAATHQPQAVRANSGSQGSARVALAVRIVPLVLLAGLLVAVVVAKPFRNAPPIRDDGAGYHAWTRAIAKREFSFCIWKGHADLISYTDPARGMCQNKYPPGLALLHLPFMGPLLDLTPHARLITSAEHQMKLALGAMTAWIIAALLTWSAMLLNVPPWRAAASVLVALFGTGLYHYATYDASFSHAHSALMAAVLLTLAIRERARGRPMPLGGVALCGFFLVAIRMTSAILLVELAAFYLAWNRHRLRDAAVRAVLPAGLGAAAAVALQLSYNYYATGAFTLSSYGEESFLFDQPMHVAVVASYERGLVTYFPIFGLAIALGFAVPAARGWAGLLAVQTISLVMLYGYWHSWMLGGGMGHRGFVELGPLVAVVLLVSVRELWRSLALLSVAGSVTCALVTLQVMLGYWRGSFPMGEASAEEYWSHLRMFESALSGGTQCTPVRCNLLKWRCRSKPQPEFSACSVNFGEPGSCTADGRCAPIVAIKSLAADNPTPFVSAPPFRQHRKRPLVTGAATIGPWEKFRLVPVRERNQVMLQALDTRRYVTLRVEEGKPPMLEANAEARDSATTFVRVGSDAQFALRAPNAKYVKAEPPKAKPRPVTVDAPEVGPWERFALVPTLP